MGTSFASEKASVSGSEPTMADVTLFGSVSGVDVNYSTTSSQSFVLDKALKLPESPLMHPLVVSSCPSYKGQVFHYYSSVSQLFNDSLTDIMVSPSHKPFPLATQLLKLPLSGSCAFSLQSTNQFIPLNSQLLNSSSEKPAVACDGEVVNSDVNAKNSLEVRASGINLFRESKQEINPAFFVHSQKALGQLPIPEISGVTVGNADGKVLSAFKQSQTENVSFELCTSGKVVSDASFAYNGFASGFFDHSTSLFNTSYGELCWQSLPQLTVNEWVQLDIVPDFSLPSLVNAELQSLTVSLNGSYDFWNGFNFDFGCCPNFHINMMVEPVFKPYAGLSSVQWNTKH